MTENEVNSSQPSRRTGSRSKFTRSSKSKYGFHIPFLSRFFTFRPSNFGSFSISSMLYMLSDYFLYLLGPCLIVFALSILTGLTYSFFTVLLPMISPEGYFTPRAIFHEMIVIFLVGNVLFNYFACVITKNGHLGANHQRVVRELADVTGFPYPESSDDRDNYQVQFKRKLMALGKIAREMERKKIEKKYNIVSDLNGNTGNNNCEEVSYDSLERGEGHQNYFVNSGIQKNDGTDGVAQKRRSNANNTSETNVKTGAISTKQNSAFTNAYTTQKPRPWMLLGPHDWSYCEYSNLPKPPRSHFDHVTKSLVLNMDHYCPWMFNVVGYFNYRYFCNFLIYVSLGMIYGCYFSWQPFFNMDGTEYHAQINHARSTFRNSTHSESETFHLSTVHRMYPNVPTPMERTPVAFTFMLCFSVGIAVSLLLGFHVYLILTAQTTIEFHGNGVRKRKARLRNEVFENPYDLGYRRNLEQVWGSLQSPINITGIATSDARVTNVGLALMHHGKTAVFVMWKILSPSWREPEYLPLPLKGNIGRRVTKLKDGGVSGDGRICLDDGAIIV